jgi:FKBP-type peptidyl-prolyl cis-trans isomerase SlyD
MEITKDMFVIIEYDLRLEDGTYIRGEGEPASLNFVAGYGQLLPALERKLLGLATGEEKNFIIPAHEAFGEHDQSKVVTKALAEFPEGRKLEAGKWAVASNSDTGAKFTYFVKDKTEEAVTMDHNHPLAGKDLYYSVKVVQVRPASKEELEYLRPCEHNKESEDPSGSLS